jgi:hypothetical protein
MARGWESKSVEDQIREREEETQQKAKKALTTTERQLKEKYDGLFDPSIPDACPRQRLPRNPKLVHRRQTHIPPAPLPKPPKSW